MATMRRVLSIILSIAICILSLTTVAFADNTIDDVNKMAESLNKINVLQGSNGDYLLSNNLNRAEATALIIRMLGKENYVKQNTEQLKYTKYSDVTSGAWYAPYVGYSTIHSIVAGNPDGTFSPTENVSEKAFIKMAICALGYEYGEDFNWTNVYQKAYEIGVVTQPLYKDKTQDNYDYRRKDAVTVIYRSLNTFIKDTEKKMAYTLVEEGILTTEKLASSGIFGEDNVMTEVLALTALAPNNIEVKLNENIQSIEVKDIEILEAESSENKLDVKSLAFRDDTVQIITSGQIPGKPYKIIIKKMIDISGNMASDVSGTFFGYTPEQVSSDFFKIQKIEQMSVNVINVYFTQPVNVNSETASYYELFENGILFLSGSVHNMTVKKLQSSNNAVSIFLKDKALKIGQVYTIRISGKLASSYGVMLADGYGETMDFSATIDQSGQLQVMSVQALTDTSVRILFNREIDQAWAGKRLNYTVSDSNKNNLDVTNANISTVGDNAGKEVILTLKSGLDKTKQYDLGIDYIPDLYKQSAVENRTIQFSGAYPEIKNLSITKTYSEYNNVVVINFSKPLDSSKATDKSNYMIRGVSNSSLTIVPEKVYYSEGYNDITVKLFMPADKKLNKSHTYIVYVSNMNDTIYGSGSTLLRGEFTAQSNNTITPQISDAVIISKDTIRLLFNMELSFSQTNLSTSNYILEYENGSEMLKMAPVGVTYIDANTLILRFSELNPQLNYNLRFNKIVDYSEMYSSTISDGDNAVNVRWGR